MKLSRRKSSASAADCEKFSALAVCRCTLSPPFTAWFLRGSELLSFSVPYVKGFVNGLR